MTCLQFTGNSISFLHVISISMPINQHWAWRIHSPLLEHASTFPKCTLAVLVPTQRWSLPQICPAVEIENGNNNNNNHHRCNELPKIFALPWHRGSRSRGDDGSPSQMHASGQSDPRHCIGASCQEEEKAHKDWWERMIDAEQAHGSTNQSQGTFNWAG